MTLTRRRKRMLAVGALVLGLAIATALALTAFQQNLMFFYSPTDIVNDDVPVGARFRIGGLVKAGSVMRGDEGLEVNFVIADCAHEVPVFFEGILPDLFREGQGIVAFGSMNDGGTFVAEEVLAKHDENYMPPEVAESLLKSGGDCMPFKSRGG